MKYGQPEGEGLKVCFDSGFRLEFHGSKVISDAGLLAYRELDDALGLFDSTSTVFADKRTGRNVQRALETLLRQSVYSCLAGYKNVNDAARMSKYPVMRAITGKIGAKVVRYSRCITFQMAGVAINRKLFAEILLRM